ncbi:MAG: hypothetical protein CL560_05525 [Alphaproteobacteria bacterium]|nr:hypothetical protein [Alphaproteobacteria bacterium]
MAFVNTINFNNNYDQELYNYYDNKLTSDYCEILFQSPITQEIYNNFTPLGVSNVDCGPNTLCALGVLSRQDAIRLSKKTSHRGISTLEMAHFMKLFLKDIKKQVTKTSLMPINIKNFTAIKNTLSDKHATAIFLSNNGNFGHYLLLMKWNNEFKLVDPQNMLVLNTDQQVNSYFSNQKWNSFVSFCIKDVAPNIKKRNRGTNAVFTTNNKKSRTARKSKKKRLKKKNKTIKNKKKKQKKNSKTK